jgi:hypothetical protein
MPCCWDSGPLVTGAVLNGLPALPGAELVAPVPEAPATPGALVLSGPLAAVGAAGDPETGVAGPGDAGVAATGGEPDIEGVAGTAACGADPPMGPPLPELP